MSTVTASIRISADCATVFRVFVEEIDAWWQRGPKYRSVGGPQGKLRFEPGPNGALIEELGGGRSHTLGKVRAWEPPYRILLGWRLINFAPDQSTEVEISFTPVGDQTRVTIEHRGLDALPEGHPARHGQASPEFEISAGRWWREILGFLRKRSETGGGE